MGQRFQAHGCLCSAEQEAVSRHSHVKNWLTQCISIFDAHLLVMEHCTVSGAAGVQLKAKNLVGVCIDTGGLKCCK
jgi:hypothetical protein